MKTDHQYEACKNCYFWSPPGDGDSANAIKYDIGHCQRFPPAATVRHNRRFAYPETAAVDWCGEYKRYPDNEK